MFFFTSAVQYQNMWNSIKHLIEILFILVALNVLEQYAFKPRCEPTVSCDYEIVFHDS